jgi:hypothetical protein
MVGIHRRKGPPVTAKPEDATWIGPWEKGRRLFDGQRWAVDHRTHDGRSYPITVAVIGTQYDDGRIQRRIVVDVPSEPITAAQSQELIAALTAAVAIPDTEAALRGRVGA